MEKLDISVFDESDLAQFQEFFLIIFSTCVGLRGCKEHVNMLRSQVGSGVYPSNHPNYPNYEWWGLLNYGNEKTHKLSISTDHVRTTHEGVGKFPVLSETEGVVGDVGGAIKRFCALQPSGSKMRDPRFYRKVNLKGTAYCVDAYLGIELICRRFKFGYRRMGFIDWMKVRPHAGRAYFLTVMANDSSIPLGYKCLVARHKDPKTLIGYTTNGLAGGANVLNAVLKATSGGGAKSNKDDGSQIGGKEVLLRNEKAPIEKKTAVEKQEQQQEDDDSVGSQSSFVLVGRARKEKPGSLKNVPDSITTPTSFEAVDDMRMDENQSVASYFSPSVASVNHHQVPVSYAPAANEKYSIYTQHQVEELRTDLVKLEINHNHHHAPPTNHYREINHFSPTANEIVQFKGKKECAPPPSNHYGQFKRYSQSANDIYSSFTQHQVDELNSDMSRVEAARRATRSFVTPSPQSFLQTTKRVRHGKPSLDQLRGFGTRNYSQPQQRVPSARELEIISIRARVAEIEQNDRLREMQEVEYERMRMYESYPFWNSYDEQKSLYEDSIENDNEREQMDRKKKKRSSKRSWF